ncbi:hypothetical protein ABZ990_24535 [Streptomyces sp. NPDC046203]|uniref:hypothetical protein n=1 Tax=Streptomyces sp. NPDC046203 TaxID=3154602 RepID=UPI00340EAAE5
MTDDGEDRTEDANKPRSRLSDFVGTIAPLSQPGAQLAVRPAAQDPVRDPGAGPGSGAGSVPGPGAGPEVVPGAVSEPEPDPESDPDPDPEGEDPQVAAARLRFAELLEEFRQTPVLVPLGEGDGPDSERGLLTADFNGLRFILAFSDPPALARYAQARGEFRREWRYQRILGARLLDVAVPAAGVPCGVALDCADGPDGMVFPPVRGVVPDEAAVDAKPGAGADGGAGVGAGGDFGPAGDLATGTDFSARGGA